MNVVRSLWASAVAISLLAGCRTAKPTTTATTVLPEEQGGVTAATTGSEKKKSDKPKYPYRAADTRETDLIHTRLEVRFDWAKRQLKGVATITARPYFYPQRTLTLDAVAFDIHSVSLLKGKKEFPLKYSYDSTQLVIKLDTLYQRDQQYTIEIEYTANPEKAPQGGSAAITSDKGLYFINHDGSDPLKPKQIWTQGETQANSRWFPTIDSPNDKMTQEMHITVDKRYKTLSNGLLTYSTDNADGTRTDVWEMKSPHAPYLFMMAIGEFAVVKDKWEGKEVSYYVEPKYEKHARAIFGRTPEMLTFFSNKLGVKYPWSKYSQVVVRDYVSGAMENTTATILMEQVQLTDKQLLDQNWDGIIAHELFHHWFGDLVTCESWANLTLNEGFANYSEYLWMEHKEGKDAADNHAYDEVKGYLQEAASKKEPLIRYHYRSREDMFDAHSYNKGGRVLHMLRKQVGDDAFFTALAVYLTRHQYKNTEIHDLRMTFEEVTGQDLNWFFDQWFLKPGHPRVEALHEYKNGNLIIRFEQSQDSTKFPIYRLPFDIDIHLANGTTKKGHFVLEHAVDSVIIPVASAPRLVQVDPDRILLAELKQRGVNDDTEAKIKAAVAASELSSNAVNRMLALKDMGARSKRDEVKGALRARLKDKFWGVRQAAVIEIGKADSAFRTEMAQPLAELALNDPKALVRAEAMEVLGKLKTDLAYNTAIKAMKDPSPATSAAGLEVMLNSNRPDKDQYITQFDLTENFDALGEVASYYGRTGDAKNMPWFLNQLEKNPDGRSTVLQAMGPYLSKVPKDQRKPGLDKLVFYAKSEKSILGKFQAFQSLGMLREDHPEAKEAMREIYETESNEMLKGYFKMLGGF